MTKNFLYKPLANMKISQITNTNYINTYKNNQRDYSKCGVNENSSNITTNYYTPVFTSVVQNCAIDKLSKFSVEEYKKLSPDFINKLRLECSQLLYADSSWKELRDIEKTHDVASDMIIDGLNLQYDKDNWVIISLGRSAASIAKVIGYKAGEDKVKYLPMTRANRFIDKWKIVNLEGTEELSSLKKYLDSIDLSADKVNESGKYYVLLDYCYTGSSLHGGYNLLTSNLLLGKNPRIQMANIMSYIPHKDPLYDRLEGYMCACRLKEYSEVKCCKNLENAAESFYAPGELSRDARLMQFKLLDNVMRKDK
ncbi:MAG: hypothetical protein K6E29_07065 [Cyanobacteria bacterium RUI128]|nr:hypothetical protein [Cyanobacteria bacterium RUI128]